MGKSLVCLSSGSLEAETLSAVNEVPVHTTYFYQPHVALILLKPNSLVIYLLRVKGELSFSKQDRVCKFSRKQ